MTQSKRNLINKLMRMYPYTEKWFLSQSDKKLWAMYYSYKPKKVIANQVASTKIVDGVTYVLTDSGIYEEVTD